MRSARGRVTLAAVAATQASRQAALHAGPGTASGQRPSPLPRAALELGAEHAPAHTVSGPVRSGRRTKVLVKSLQRGEIALIDHLDIDRVSEALERFAHNTIEHMREERELLAGRIELPRFRTDFRDRSTLVVVRGVGHQRDLRALRPFIRDMRPVIIAVDGGAEALLEEGIEPSMIVGDMDSAGEAALRGGAELVVHSYADGHAPGRERLEQLGLPFKLVAAPGTSQDLALLIAAERGARLIVSVGSQFNLVEFLDRNRKGMSSTFLTRLRVGEILVDAKGVSRLYRPRPGLTPLLVVIAAGLIALIAVVWMTPALRDVAELLWLKLQTLAEVSSVASGG